MFLNILRLTTEIRGPFAEDMFEHFPYFLRDDTLEGLVGKGCSGAEGGVGGVLGKCSVHYDIGLEGFVMEEFSHISYQNVKKWIGRINMVKVIKNMVLLLDGGCDV